jgi:pyridoxal biosynthesis lyase PdxS
MAPRKPAHLRTLEFREAADFLQKLNREIARVRDVKETTDVIDHATNAAMTAWHLTDWAWHDIEKDKTADPFRFVARIAGEPIRSLEGFQTFARTASEDVRYCESIAVASKHFGSSGAEFSSAVQQRTEETSDARKATALSFLVSPLGTEMRHMRTVAKLVLVEDKHRLPVLNILTGARDWWSDLFSNIKLA